MKQVTQTLKTGTVEVNEVPVPTLTDQFVLVQTTASVISAGTEKSKIDLGNKNLLQKAKARPDLVKQVVQKIRTEGFSKTFQTVNSRLASPSPLGYSAAGKVYAVGGLVEGLQPGDRVACAGAGYANHAEYMAVPKNLVVKIPDSVTDEHAAFSTLGAIALQGVRLADPKMGETFLVLGLGLLGQITVQLLKANGCNVIGVDLDPSLIKLAESFGAIGAYADPENICSELTRGYGVDGVLVCAGTSSNQPIELCGSVTREKGRVVVVGAVRMDIPREDFFKKEISVVISRSYGPGRYDPVYEESGNDYPYGYVRFTEQRNLETFLGLVAEKRVQLDTLITHRFPLESAAEAYQLIEGKRTEPYLGIVLQYRPALLNSLENMRNRISVKCEPIKKSLLGVSFFGAGNYATASLLPPMSDSSEIEFRGLVTASGRTAQGVAQQFGFRFCAAKFDELLTDDTDAIVVSTRHDTHAQSVIHALNGRKHVYVEKPLGLSIDELAHIYTAKVAHSASQLMVGFNRRFAPLTVQMREHFQSVKSPLVINIRVNAGAIPADHWIQDPHVGGGRIIGEACHFVDLASTLSNASPAQVFALGAAKSNRSAMLNDNVTIGIKFDNGSIANIIYTADGSKAMAKEYVEVFGGGRSAVLQDFKELQLFQGTTEVKKVRVATQDKGQKSMIAAWINGLKNGVPAIRSELLFLNSLATVLAVESIACGVPLDVKLSLLDNDHTLASPALTEETVKV